MRTTQFIGLTNQAREFVKNANKAKLIRIGMGIAYEDVFGGEFTMPNGTIFQEIVQVCPWSSGPMFFTCLKNTSTGELLYQWQFDENLIDEFDCENGKYKV